MTSRRAVIGLGLAAALNACAPSAGRGAVLKVGSQKGGTKALVLASGVLAGARYQVEWSEFPAAQHLLEAVGAGAVDLGAAGDAPFLFDFASGGKVRAVHAARSASGGRSTALVVPGTSSAQTIADLRGQRIATGRGSIGHYLLLRLLDRAGLALQDVEITFLTPGDAKAAFSTGAIAGWVTWGSYLVVSELRDGARRIGDGVGLLSGYGFEIASLPALEAKRPQIADFLGRLSSAERWAATHPRDYAVALAKETGLDLEIAQRTADALRSEPAPIDDALVAEERGVFARFVSAGAITVRPDIAQAFDRSFASAVRL
jgi:sulfonate transport system substrate-binding protein